MNRTKSFLLLALALGAVSCSHDVTAVQPGDRYVLRSVAGQTLPALVQQNVNFTSRVVADTIVLRPDGTGTMTIELRFGGSPAPEESGQTERLEFIWTVSGNTMTINFVCPGFALCVQTPHYVGEVIRTGIRFDKAMEYRTPLQFELVSR